ncbi:MAG: NAD(+)/NADH kinase [DPANN group archaeon]|nr:NAD(+)/NADH kinase [DPANN group archaeon]
MFIVSTPMGSTVYSLSAGGPIVAPNSNVNLIIPVNSMNQAIKPIIVSDKCIINISNISSGSGNDIIFDG